MPNSDTQYGIHNKLTKEYRFYADNDVITQSFAGNVETAKAHFLTADALTNNDTNGTQLEYAITADGNGLKMTIAFGHKASAGIAEADDWAGIWTTTKDALAAANNLFKTVSYTKEEFETFVAEPRATDGDSHLF